MSAVEVVDKLARGDVYGRRITFPEGLTIREMADALRDRASSAPRAILSPRRATRR